MTVPMIRSKLKECNCVHVSTSDNPYNLLGALVFPCDDNYIDPCEQHKGRGRRHRVLVPFAPGALLGLVAGDALGSQTEFMGPEEVRRCYPDGVRDLDASRVWQTAPGQPTDDSELAFALARSILSQGGYNAEAAKQAYIDWQASDPFDIGGTIGTALREGPQHPVCQRSESNGAMMRAAPLGVLGYGIINSGGEETVASWAAQDCALTHPAQICLELNQLFVLAVAIATREQINLGASRRMLLWRLEQFAENHHFSRECQDLLQLAQLEPVRDFHTNAGWVRVAFHNAIWHLSQGQQTFEAALIETASHGGDADTNAAICGALLGALMGRSEIPDRWRHALRDCRTDAEGGLTQHPRPDLYHPRHAETLGIQLTNLAMKLRV